QAGAPAALVDPVEVFLAPAAATPKEKAAERRQPPGGRAIDGQQNRGFHFDPVSLLFFRRGFLGAAPNSLDCR
ncbi:hypothetical protein, partial [Rhodoblastus sp.]|uniref:hypothetical protein n=1 Tax=Rhodoblastus sp. TaxID=1962975 RepID=UPI003F983A35